MAQECSGKATDLDQITHARIVEREGRRRRRRELRSKKQPNVEVHFEGQSSDDEILQSTKVQFESEKGEYTMLFNCCMLFIMINVYTM